ncbi:AMP-binding protein (plasmid) [Rhodococcus pyridinivorans]|uniref:AMP-binding protein n=1 Tax=Rhodococcus TaxID=1827 RepID=UPI0009EEFCDE|nr:MULTISPECIES: AMP-binding protein [Rhodococcus]MCT7293644.1 AMP-binding protein [Rhodococcus sp. PAE-6]QXU56428.1 AMP-binding protein [Rhodococcus sp. LW-XY12]UQB75797.1 AMP-binding protein [Rhodococcus ruber]UVT27485.1 AMP-binding protein [Rhodococcus pyridinivorans]WML66461.1 AMP-binding protein [Rhodococcus sp. AH-ZY2]
MRSFEHYALNDPGRVALVADGRTTMTFGEVAASTNRIVNFLAEQPCLGEGSSVAVLMPDGPEQIVAQRAVLQRPLYLTPLNRHLTRSEIAYVIADSDARILLTTAEFMDLAAAGVADAGTDCVVIDVGDLTGDGANGWFHDESTEVTATTAAGSRMFYTSGTTGRPKGVRRALRGVTPQEAAQLAVARGDTYGVDVENGVFLSTAPMYHTAGSVFVDQALALGHAVVVAPKWDPRICLDLIGRHAVTWTYLVPMMMSDLLALDVADRSRYDTRSLRRIVHTAAPCPPVVKRGIIEWLGPVVTEIYGGTEGTATFITSEEWLEHPGSVGRAGQATELSVRDEHGNPLSAGEVGLIYFRSTLPTFLSRRRGQDGKVPVERDDHAGGPRIPGRGWLPVRDRARRRPDHLGRGEHLSRRSRARTTRSSRSDRRVCSGAQGRTVGRECPCRCSGFRPR